MDADLWSDVCRILDHVLELPSEENERYLDALPDPALAAEVRRFVRAAGVPHPLLESIDHAGPGLVEQVLLLPTPDAPCLPVGNLAGPFRLDAVAGRGGHGTVYRAHDTDADRTVAVKVLSSRREDVYVRLRSEVRVLARLDHPGVARFYSAGQTDDGRAYFAMEWVDGPPITAFADARSLAFEARLRLLVQTAEAVQHAHERLVLHRDLKPDNVLVVDAPGGPQVKVVDLGIGKITGEGAPDDAAAPYLRLTPAYAAPEQLRGEPASVASDVYSLGVLGRELLFADAQPETEAARDAEAALAKALALDPARRYPTASAFRDDLRRVQDGRAVSVRTVGRAERVRRFVRRHRQRVALAFAVAALFLTTAALYLWDVTRARAEAEREAAAANEAMAMLGGVFASADPFSAQTDTLRAHQIVDAAAAAFRASPPATDAVRARMACALAGIYVDMQVFTPARPLFDVCLAADEAPPTPDWALAALNKRVALAYHDGDTARAIGYARRGLRASAAARGTQSAAYVQALAALGQAHSSAQQYDRSAAALEEASTLARRVYGPAATETARLLSEYAHALGILDRDAEAIPLFREALGLYMQHYGPDHPAVVLTLDRMSLSYFYTDRPGEARRLLEQALQSAQRTRDADHPVILEAEYHLAQYLMQAGETEQALARMRGVYTRKQVRLGADNPYVLFDCSTLGDAERKAGRRADARARLAECHRRAVRVLGDDDVSTLLLGLSLAKTERDLGAHASCERAARDLAPRFARADPDQTHDWIALTLAGECALGQGGRENARRAERDARTALDSLRRDPYADDSDVSDARALLDRARAAQQ